jgi:hypothetical protein
MGARYLRLMGTGQLGSLAVRSHGCDIRVFVNVRPLVLDSVGEWQSTKRRQHGGMALKCLQYLNGAKGPHARIREW